MNSLAKLMLGAAACAVLTANDTELHRAFQGKEVTLRIDMPGTHNGVNLHLDRDEPMDWKEYSQRIKNFGVSIRKGQTSRITLLNVKKDLIEFQLDGGGFGTFGDDTSTTVSTTVYKSSYERRLESDLRRETNPSRRRSIESALSRERSRRYREESRLRAQAEPANAMKRQQVMDHRLNGGSRFNLRGLAGTADVSPRQVMDWLREYVDFGNLQAQPARPAAVAAPAVRTSTGPALRRGMPLDEVREQFGDGKLTSEVVGADGILTQHWEFLTRDHSIAVTSVEGLVVKYVMKAR